MEEASLTVGIDLGTTNSLIGALVAGKPMLIGGPNADELLPSVVGVDEAGAVVVGRAARNRRLLDPARTAVEVKRKMGTADRVRVGDSELSPQQVSALILSALLDRAEAKLGARPRRAVITVPAFFDDAQRQATRDAGEIAGLEVERLVNEPTAAALCYETGKEETVLVYDFGGGTFDTSILARDDGFLEVKTSRGDTRLGGSDIDRALRDNLLQKLGSERERVERDPRAMTRLIEAVERAKIALSERDEVRIFEPFLAGEGARAVHLDLQLTLSLLESVAKPFIQRTLRSLDEALRDAKLTPRDLDRVLLVGGSSRLRAVESAVQNHLGRPVVVDPDADRLVARGASILAGRAAGLDVDEILIDITPHTLAAGVALIGPDENPLTGELVAHPLIPRDSVVPIERSETYYTSQLDQPVIRVPILQGEEELAEDNLQLGELEIRGLPPSPNGSPVEVTFRLDLSGVLQVSAMHVPSAKSAEVVIANSPSRLSEARRTSERAEIEQLRKLESSGTLQVTESDRKLAQALLVRAEHALDQSTSAEASSRVRTAMHAVVEAVEHRSPELPDKMDDLSDALLDLV